MKYKIFYGKPVTSPPKYNQVLQHYYTRAGTTMINHYLKGYKIRHIFIVCTEWEITDTGVKYGWDKT